MSKAEQKRAAELIRSSGSAYEHFFAEADDPGWLAPLAAEGFFKDPHPAERGPDWVRYPFWPESKFLVRVAARAPEAVAAIAETIPDTDNIRVHEDMLRIASQLPATLARRLTRRETQWLHGYTGHLVSLPDAIAGAVGHLAEVDELDAAYGLALEALAIQPYENDDRFRVDAGRARINEYEYGRIVAHAWPLLAQSDALRALAFLCDRLQDLVALQPRDGLRDPTSIWRPAVEHHGQNSGHSLLDLLVDLVRDQAAVTVRDLGVPLDSVLHELARLTSPIFDRIAINLVREQGQLEHVAAYLSDSARAFDISRWHEYGELLGARFRDLDDTQRSDVCAALDAGYPQERVDDLTGRATEEQIATWQQRDLLARYTLIRAELDPEHRTTLDRLQEEFPEPDHPTFLSYTTSWVGPTSPLDANELRGLTSEQIARELNTWQPTGEALAPTPEGFGRVLSQVVEESPSRFASAARDFEGLEPTYIRALLGGFASAAKGGKELDWDPILGLCRWVVEQPRSALDVNDDFDRDAHWGPARQQIADLLGRGFADGPAQLNIGHRQDVWTLLAALAEDPDPTPAYEEKFGGDNSDPATLSINTARGEAMHSAMRYALWVERHESVDGMASLPEVQRLLERRLDASIEPSVAVRSVYGQWFPQLVRIDAQWARDIAPMVFPEAPDKVHLFSAAWQAYILFNQPFDDVYSVLEDVYRRAADLADASSARLLGDPRERLGDHLFFFHARGVLGPLPNVLTAYWQRATPSLRAQVLTSVGWSLERGSGLDTSIVERLTAAWDWIVEQATPDDPDPLSAFGAWLGADGLPADWRLRQAAAILDLGIHLEPDHTVYDALARLAAAPDADLQNALRVLWRMLVTDTEAYSPWGSVEPINAILRSAAERNDPAAHRQAREIADLLTARGIVEFRDLA